MLKTLLHALLAPLRGLRDALYATIDAWRDTLPIELEPLSPEEYQAISAMLDTLELSPEEFAGIHAGIMLDSEYDFA